MMGTDEDKWASLAAELGLADGPSPREEPAAEAAPAKRGRGRGRRSAPRKKAVVEDAAPPIMEEVMEDALVTEDVLTADGEGPAKKRRRRRSRKKKGTVDGVATSNGEGAVAVLDDDDAPVTTPADWKMPTWQELIDSLHRS